MLCEEKALSRFALMKLPFVLVCSVFIPFTFISNAYAIAASAGF